MHLLWLAKRVGVVVSRRSRVGGGGQVWCWEKGRLKQEVEWGRRRGRRFDREGLTGVY